MRSRSREAERTRLSEVAAKFEQIACVLRELDVDRLWGEATDQERRILVEELLESVAMYPDHLEVTVSGVPRLNVPLEEVGLSGGWQLCGGGGPTSPNCHPGWRIRSWPGSFESR